MNYNSFTDIRINNNLIVLAKRGYKLYCDKKAGKCMQCKRGKRNRSCRIIQKIYRNADKIKYRPRTTIDPKNVRPRRTKNKKNFVNNLLHLGHKILGNAIKTKIVSKLTHRPRHGLKKKIVKKIFHHPRKGHGKKIAKKISKHSGTGHGLGVWG